MIFLPSDDAVVLVQAGSGEAWPCRAVPASLASCITMLSLPKRGKGDSVSGSRSGTTGRHSHPSGVQGIGRRDVECQRRIGAAREEFAAGADTVCGVRPGILLSWYRCRDVYGVDPGLAAAPGAAGRSDHSLLHDIIFTQLGGAAATAAHRTDMRHCVIAVTDGDGRILASWGPRRILRHGTETSLAPRFAWSEESTGTNGMGTALEQRGAMLVRGAEHWCEGFQDGYCAGVAINDPVSRKPLAALNVSAWQQEPAESTAGWLSRTATAMEADLRERAVKSAADLVSAFAGVESTAPGAVMAVDTAGKLVMANAAARRLLGMPVAGPALHPEDRQGLEIPAFVRTIGEAVRRAQRDPGWSGATELVIAEAADAVQVEVDPVYRDNEVVGMLLIGSGSPCGEPLDDIPEGKRATFPPRIAAMRENSLVLLSPNEIRYAEADSHTVWLVSDQGRLRAASRTLERAEQELLSFGFLRVHRRFLVNVGRIREMDQGFKGGLTLTTDHRGHETIPVSRRHAARLRRALGL
ncbi:MAG: DNA-binding protein [Pseudonocardiaceae bacterium]|nr:DNA-binding protein [Pseudonocardiaceae bacterium]